MKKFARVFIGLALVLSLISVAMFFVVTDKTPTVAETSISGLNDAESVTKLLGQLQTSIHDRKNPSTVIITKVQIESLLAFIERAKPEIRSRAALSNYMTSIQVSYSLPDLWFNRYVNLYVSLMPGQQIHIDSVQVGAVILRGDWALNLLVMLVDWWTRSDIATYAAAQITNISMSPERVSISMKPLEGLLRQLNEVKNGISVEQDDWLSQRTAFYIRFLARTSVNNLDIYENVEPSLSIYLAAVMREAMRSGTEAPEKENEAAILALTIFAGHHRFANFVGTVHNDPDRAPQPPHPTRLAMRKDLSQHYIISAGLKLLSEKGLTAAIGEFKELMDRVLGGSGYSFVDLAADMAGVRLAQMAIDPNHAARLQQRLADIEGEAMFFPPIDGLPEGLSKSEFSQRYGNVNSPEYLAMIEQIELRLDQLPLFNTSNR